jgi:hypothetical protein
VGAARRSCRISTSAGFVCSPLSMMNTPSTGTKGGRKGRWRSGAGSGKMRRVNRLWGAPRIHGELLKPGIESHGRRSPSCMVTDERGRSQFWTIFLHNDVAGIGAMGFQNGHAVRLMGSIRRDRLDHIVVIGEAR